MEIIKMVNSKLLCLHQKVTSDVTTLILLIYTFQLRLKVNTHNICPYVFVEVKLYPILLCLSLVDDVSNLNSTFYYISTLKPNPVLILKKL